MLSGSRIKEIALDVARTTLAPQPVNDVLIEPTVTWDGDEALWVMTVVPSDDAPLLTGRKITDYMMQLREKLEQEGDHRRPIPRWATPADLAADLLANDDC